MKKELCMDTLQQLKNAYGKRLSGAILHSDRGSRYTSGAFCEELRIMGMIQSLSGVHHCYDNARMESFCDAEEGKAVPDSDTSDDKGYGQDGNLAVCVWLIQHDPGHKFQS